MSGIYNWIFGVQKTGFERALEQLHSFDPDQFELDILVSLPLDILNNPQETERTVKKLTKERIKILCAIVIAEQGNASGEN